MRRKSPANNTVEYKTTNHTCQCGVKFEMKVPFQAPLKQKIECKKYSSAQYFVAIVFTALCSILLTTAGLIIYHSTMMHN